MLQDASAPEPVAPPIDQNVRFNFTSDTGSGPYGRVTISGLNATVDELKWLHSQAFEIAHGADWRVKRNEAFAAMMARRSSVNETIPEPLPRTGL